MTEDRYAFDRFPQGNLSFRFNRRQLWTELKTGYDVIRAKHEQGVNTYTLSNLGNWPDEQLAEVTPMIVPDCKITAKEGYVWGQPPSSDSATRLFPLDSRATTAFNLFNGLNTLYEVNEYFAPVTGWDSSRSFAYARGLFLSLVLAGVCLPKYEV